MTEYTDAEVDNILREIEEEESAPAEKPVDPRRAHQCRRDGCDSAIVWDVYLHLRYGWHHIAIETIGPIKRLRCCDKHRKAASEFLLSEANKKAVSTQLAVHGRLGIDWDNAMIEFVPHGEAAWGPGRMQQVA